MPTRSFDRLFSTPADCAACREAIRQGSRSFHLASLLLPVSIREPAYAVYAFCRMADDRIDRDGGGLAAVAAMERMLDRVYAGRPSPDVVERAFADVVAAHAIPRAVPAALLEGLAWDAEGRRYRTMTELRAYAVRVAGTVGAMMALVMDRRRPEVLARACDLGVAMQLTNICRDIGEDARAGRIYLPLERLAREGIDAEAFLARPEFSAGVRAVAHSLLDEAEALYDRALSGVAALPRPARTGIGAARLLYREIGRKVAAGSDPVAERAVVPGGRKLALLAQAIAAPVLAPVLAPAAARWPALAEARFLVEAVGASPEPRRVSEPPRWWEVGARAVRMVELLIAFERRPGRPPAPLAGGEGRW